MAEEIRPDLESKMAEQLAGFGVIARVRRFTIQASMVAAILMGVASGAQEGLKKGLTTAFLTLIFGVAGGRLLTGPFALYLWWKNWVCPACHKRLGRRVITHCPHCGVRLFDPDKRQDSISTQ